MRYLDSALQDGARAVQRKGRGIELRAPYVTSFFWVFDVSEDRE